MNSCEKKNLIEKSKEAIKAEFKHVGKTGWASFFGHIEKNEFLSAMTILLNAKSEKKEVNCSFDNQFVDENDLHKLWIHGEERIPLDYDNVLAIDSSGHFVLYFEENDVTVPFVSIIDLVGIDSYSGRILYTGIVNEETELGLIDISDSCLVYKTNVYMIEEQSAMWKKYFAESYRLYTSE